MIKPIAIRGDYLLRNNFYLVKIIGSISFKIANEFELIYQRGIDKR